MRAHIRHFLHAPLYYLFAFCPRLASPFTPPNSYAYCRYGCTCRHLVFLRYLCAAPIPRYLPSFHALHGTHTVHITLRTSRSRYLLDTLTPLFSAFGAFIYANACLGSYPSRLRCLTTAFSHTTRPRHRTPCPLRLPPATFLHIHAYTPPPHPCLPFWRQLIHPHTVAPRVWHWFSPMDLHRAHTHTWHRQKGRISPTHATRPI